jgi:hypothetical protein
MCGYICLILSAALLAADSALFVFEIEALAACKQPHELVLPEYKLEVRTSVVFPHSHLQFITLSPAAPFFRFEL